MLETRRSLIDFLVEDFDVDRHVIMGSHLLSDLGLDTSDLYEFATVIQDGFCVQVPVDLLSKLTLDQLASHLKNLTGR